MVIGRKERLYNAAIALILVLIGLLMLVPLLYVLSVSFSPLSAVLQYGFTLLPRAFTIESYARILAESLLPQAFRVTAVVTLIGTGLSLGLTVMLAYPLSQRDLPGRTLFSLLILFTMLFSGGMIPTYLLVRSLGMLNTLWSMILPGAIWTFCVIILRSFFEQLPGELLESARIDGVGEWRALAYIVLPLSPPALMTVGLYYAVGYWKQFFPGLMYITQPELYPLQVIIRQILMRSMDMYNNPDVVMPTQSMQMAAVVVAALPVVAVYPFIQKHFTKGMLLGAVKG